VADPGCLFRVIKSSDKVLRSLNKYSGSGQGFFVILKQDDNLQLYYDAFKFSIADCTYPCFAFDLDI
jgi:hypothetical protein